MPRINQVQINSKIGLDFASVLRSSLRQDPDVMFIGEMRDKETVDIGLRAAMTGHLVLSSLHTNDAIATVMRLIDMGAEPFLVASSINAILAQRLMRRICDQCIRSYVLTNMDMAWLEKVGKSDLKATKFASGVGCNSCNNTGFKGRIAIHELLECDESLSNFIRSGDYAGFKRAATQQEGYLSITHAAIEAAISGVTSFQEVIRISGWIH